jgi:hypothetical protein
MNCNVCEWLKDGECKKAKNLSIVDDPICLQKIQIMLLRDVLDELYYVGECLESEEDTET